MIRKNHHTPLLIVALLTAALAGCLQNQPPNAGPTAGTPAPAAPSQEAQIRESLAKLSEADRKSAESQRVCAVTDAPLGIMGTPVKVAVEGRDVWLCCAGCRSELESEPAKYLAKLDQAAKP